MGTVRDYQTRIMSVVRWKGREGGKEERRCVMR